jgi:purine-nucleoside phosphorylase
MKKAGKAVKGKRANGATALGVTAFAMAERAAKFILLKTKLRPRVAVVLGSGLGDFADSLTEAVSIPYAKIPGFPHSTAFGHAGRLVIGKSGTTVVAAMQGRVHLYEGYSAAEVTYPIRALGRAGIRSLVLTNAAGGINTEYSQGALVVLRDHINLQATNPLIGANDDRFGTRFPDMTTAYWRAFREITAKEAMRLGMELHEGVYAAVTGPSFETPAEIRYLRAIGADLVGMSTVLETIVARHMGIRVLGISCVTNMAAGILDQPLSHEEVIETGQKVKTRFTALLRAVLPELSADARRREQEAGA